MINTICSECTAKFHVSEDLVVGKVVRFRCRKCGGTITVDGTTMTADGKPKDTESHKDLRRPSSPQPKENYAVTREYCAAVGAEVSQAAMREELGEHDAAQRPRTLRPGSGAAGSGLQDIPKADPLRGLQQQAANVQPTITSAADDDPSERVTVPVPIDPLAVGPTSEEPVTLRNLEHKPQDNREPPTLASVPKPQERSSKKSPPAPEVANKSTTDHPPSSKPRLARVSMSLGSVFDVPPSDDADVPVDFDEAPSYEEDVEPEPEPLVLPGLRKGPDSSKLKAPPPPKGALPPAPRITPPKPTPSRESTIDLDEMMRASRPVASKRSFEAVNIFAPVALPTSSAEPRVSAPMVLPERDEPELKQRSNKTIVIGVAVAVAALALAGVGALALSGDRPEAAPIAQLPAEPEEPENTTLGARKGTPAAEPRVVPAVEAPKEEPAVAEAKPPEPEATASAKPEEPKPSDAKALAASNTNTAAKSTAPSAQLPKEPGAEPKPPATTAAAAPPPPAEPPKPAEPAKTAAPASGGAAFDRGAASSAIAGAKGSAAGCKQEGGPQGHARVSITFAPTGRVTTAVVNGPPFAGTSVGGCIASRFRGLRVPAFDGPAVTVQTSVGIF